MLSAEIIKNAPEGAQRYCLKQQLYLRTHDGEIQFNRFDQWMSFNLKDGAFKLWNNSTPIVDWPKAFEGATHALTTGPNWEGDKELIGTVEFAVLKHDARYFNNHTSCYVIGDDSWIVVEERPTRTAESSAIETLSRLGYEWKGGELWKPPTGKVPSYVIDADNIDSTITERGNRYGRFADGSVTMQDLKDVMRATDGWQRLTPSQREALEMIQHKIGRILNGDPTYDDNWRDIAGYAKLVLDELNGVRQ